MTDTTTSAEAYTVRLISAPGRSYDREGITREELADVLRAVANGLEITDTPFERLTVEIVSPARRVGDAARELYDDLAAELLQREIDALEQRPRPVRPSPMQGETHGPQGNAST